MWEKYSPTAIYDTLPALMGSICFLNCYFHTETAEKTWQLKRKMDNGEVRNLPGSRKVYQEKYSKIPKSQP